MDDRNGECFEHHEDLYGDVALNTSDSEHECLKEFLLEPRDSLRNVPCVGNDIADVSHAGNQNTSIENEINENSVNSTDERTEDGIPPNCVQDSCSSTAVTTNSDDEEKNGEYFSPVHSEYLSEPVTSEKVRHIEGATYKEETEEEENSSETSLAVQKNDDIEKSTKYSNNRLGVDAAAGVKDLSKREGLVSKSEIDINDIEVGNGHSAEIHNPPKARNSAPRGRKRKIAGDTESTRGRPASTRKEKHPVTYQSQISPDQNGIKIRIKKSSTATTKVQRTHRRGRKRRGKKGSNTDDEISTDSESNKRVRWGDTVISEGDDDNVDENEEENIGEQSVWGEQMPKEILGKIFFLCTQEEGCLPFLIRMARVCKLWRDAALTPSLWCSIDFSLPYVKQKYKNVEHLRWLCENRLRKVQELSMGVWKHSFYQQAMDLVAEYCPDLKGLNLMGWKGLLPDHLRNVLANCQQLARLDLSYINTDSTTSKGFVSPVSISHLTQTLGSKLTHLTLANNKLAGIPQLITAIAVSRAAHARNLEATHCPNLEVLDLSNVRTYANTTAPLHIEKLQEGCQKLRVLRVTNSQVTLSTASLKEQVASPGFPALEELSVAGTSMDGMCFTTVIDDNAIERILKTSQKLKLLDVRGCVRVTDSSLVRVPAWDLEHLFLSGCYVTRLTGSGLELIAQKWSHSLIEVDLAWSTATQALDLAVSALAERGAESPLRVLNLCGSSVSFNPVKAVLMHCSNLISLNLSSCRALPRGIKRLYEGSKVVELRESLEEKPEVEKAKEEEKMDEEEETQENEPAQAESGSARSGTMN